MKTINTKLNVKQIVFDTTLYPRNQHSWQVAYDYSESMKTGAVFPRICVAKLNNSFVLIDGKHRLEAYKKLKIEEVECEVLVGLNKEQMYIEAVKRNMSHGKQFSVQEKLGVALRLKDMKYPASEISKIVQIIPSKLTNLIGRKMTNTITGQEIILKSEFENLADGSKPVPQDIEYIQQSFTGQNPGKLIEELIVLVEGGIIDLNNQKLKGKLNKLKTLLNNINLD